MQPTIRIIKRGAGGRTNSPVNQSDKTDRQIDREMTNTVKGWIVEWETRNRLVQAAAFSLVRSLENNSGGSTRQLAVVNG
jgi:hypothetical protein